MIAVTAAAFFVVALLYSSVGHAGASGYLAVMALLGTAPASMRPTALILNILVAALGARSFISAGHFKASLAGPLLATSIPMAFIGGRMELPVDAYRAVIGAVLLLSAIRLLVQLRDDDRPGRPPKAWIAMMVGAALGFLAGLTGIGGGIFLSPLLLLAGWANLRTTAATSVVFIFANSAAGLLGQMSSLDALPSGLPVWAGAVVAGGAVGSWLGAQRLASPVIRGMLAVVLVTAGIKLI
jgi:uncharacterized membrane protein YfcA